MPKIDMDALETTSGSSYPAPHNAGFEKRHSTRMGPASGLTQFGANHVRLEPGAMSSQRHWHEEQDEFLVVTEGALTLVDDAGETELRPGDCCAFPKGDANGHHIVNTSGADGCFVVVGAHTATEQGWYSDIDMMVRAENGVFSFTRRDGSPIDGDGS